MIDKSDSRFEELSYFVNNLHDYKPNWIPLSPIVIAYQLQFILIYSFSFRSFFYNLTALTFCGLIDIGGNFQNHSK